MFMGDLVNGFGTTYYFNQPIRPDTISVFKIRMTIVKSQLIAIALVDYEKEKQNRIFTNPESRNHICYTSAGLKGPSLMREGGGFKSGDVLDVQVNRQAGWARIYVNGKLVTSFNDKLLKDASRVLYPAVNFAKQSEAV